MVEWFDELGLCFVNFTRALDSMIVYGDITFLAVLIHIEIILIIYRYFFVGVKK